MNSSFLPNFFILGAAKCATTSLHNILDEFPDICMSNPKEPFFFECEYDKGLDFYRQKYFAHYNGERVIGESRHRNLYLTYTAERIYRINPNAKLLISVRNPITRAYSQWWHWYARGVEKLSFKEAVREDYRRIQNGESIIGDNIERHCRKLEAEGVTIFRTYLDSGYYFDQIDIYRQLFDEKSIKVIVFEDFVQDYKQAISDILDFLELPDALSDNHTVKVKNEALEKSDFPQKSLIRRGFRRINDHIQSSGAPDNVKRVIADLNTRYHIAEKKPKMEPDIREWLYEHYLPYNRKMETYLNRDLSHWK